MSKKSKSRVEITHDEHKALKSLEENLKRQSKERTEFAITAKDLLSDYNKLYPPNVFKKAFKVPNISVSVLESLLVSLAEKGLVIKELRNYSDRPLKVETRFFKLSEEGRIRLLPKK